ncbi:hypothetical protein PR048_003522 [Dryococelus australis]|uniref:Uncharacterized protein n=1 Tax=Dryococelus australis TaxID=614101 RepID=A0ABQ9INU2_9NEOP|nr:hypothetical protein PR048_003522 [Dryococelus australis]
MEHRWNARAWELEDPRETSPTNGIVRCELLRATPTGLEIRFFLVEGKREKSDVTVEGLCEELSTSLYVSLVRDAVHVQFLRAGAGEGVKAGKELQTPNGVPCTVRLAREPRTSVLTPPPPNRGPRQILHPPRNDVPSAPTPAERFVGIVQSNFPDALIKFYFQDILPLRANKAQPRLHETTPKGQRTACVCTHFNTILREHWRRSTPLNPPQLEIIRGPYKTIIHKSRFKNYLRGTRPLELFPAFEAEERRTDKGDTASRIKCAIVAKRKALRTGVQCSRRTACTYWWKKEFQSVVSKRAALAERLACSPPTSANRVQSPAGLLPDFRKWGSCRTMPLVGGFSRGSPVSPPRPYIPLIDSQYFAVKSRPNLFTHYSKKKKTGLKSKMASRGVRICRAALEEGLEESRGGRYLLCMARRRRDVRTPVCHASSCHRTLPCFSAPPPPKKPSTLNPSPLARGVRPCPKDTRVRTMAARFQSRRVYFKHHVSRPLVRSFAAAASRNCSTFENALIYFDIIQWLLGWDNQLLVTLQYGVKWHSRLDQQPNAVLEKKVILKKKKKLGLAVLVTRPFVLREYVYVDALGRLDVYFTFPVPLHSIIWGFMDIAGLILKYSFQPFGDAMPNCIPRFCYLRIFWVASHYGSKFKDVLTSTTLVIGNVSSVFHVRRLWTRISPEIYLGLQLAVREKVRAVPIDSLEKVSSTNCPRRAANLFAVFGLQPGKFWRMPIGERRTAMLPASVLENDFNTWVAEKHTPPSPRPPLQATSDTVSPPSPGSREGHPPPFPSQALYLLNLRMGPHLTFRDEVVGQGGGGVTHPVCSARIAVLVPGPSPERGGSSIQHPGRRPERRLSPRARGLCVPALRCKSWIKVQRQGVVVRETGAPRGNPPANAVRLLASHQDEPGSTPDGFIPGFSHVGIVPGDAAGRRVFSGISRLPRLLIPALLHARLASPSSALKISMLRVIQISSFTRYCRKLLSPSGLLCTSRVPYVEWRVGIFRRAILRADECERRSIQSIAGMVTAAGPVSLRGVDFTRLALTREERPGGGHRAATVAMATAPQHPSPLLPPYPARARAPTHNGAPQPGVSAPRFPAHCWRRPEPSNLPVPRSVPSPALAPRPACNRRGLPPALRWRLLPTCQTPR